MGCQGSSVRLVRPVQMVSFSINATPSPAEGGEVSGGGAYQQGAECTLTATANEGFTFSCWTENGEVVSENEIYTFAVTGARNLVANFTSTNPEPAGVVITLRPGWNWISFLLETEMLIEDALVNLTPCDGDMLKSQDNFATYKADLGQWSGSLRTMIPGQGYIYQRNGEQTTFTYPKE